MRRSRARARPSAADMRSLGADRVGDLQAYGANGIEGSPRVLEDHRDGCAMHASQLAGFRGGNVLAVEQDAPAGDATGGIKQPRDGEGRDRFSRAAFTDNAERLAGIDRQVDAA